MPLLALPLLVSGCVTQSTVRAAPTRAVTAPAPGVTLPPDYLALYVPKPEEVPPGMVLIVKGSGVRDITTVAGYSGTGAVATAAAAQLAKHGFVRAYVAQYADQASGAVLSVVVSAFKDDAGAAADFADDEKAKSGTPVTVEALGSGSSATVQPVQGGKGELLILRFHSKRATWSLAYQAAPKADPAVAVALAKKILARLPA